MRLDTLEKTKSNAPNFNFRVSDATARIRMYLHASHDKKILNTEFLNTAKSKTSQFSLDTKPVSYVLAAAWYDEKTGESVIDWFEYCGLDDSSWRTDAHVKAYVIRGTTSDVVLEENLECITSPHITCGDFVRILGAEEDYRRTTLSMHDYLNYPPRIPGLQATTSLLTPRTTALA